MTILDLQGLQVVQGGGGTDTDPLAGPSNLSVTLCGDSQLSVVICICLEEPGREPRGATDAA